jgi:hypothetical protein
MGRYQDGNYYRNEDDAELQWLEDGIGLTGKTLVFGVCALALGLCQLGYGLFKLLTSDDA